MKNIISTLILYLCVILKIKGLDAQFYWNCSALDHIHQHYYVPDLGTKFNSNFFGRLKREKKSSPPPYSGSISIYPASSTLSCSGTVTAVRYCYRVQHSRMNFGQNIVFTLLFLHQNELTFYVTREFTVSSEPTPKICSPGTTDRSMQYCCDTRTVSDIDLPSSGFAYGILNAELLHLSDFNVRYYEVQPDAIGISQIQVQSGSIQGDKPLPYLQFIVSPVPATVAPATSFVAPTVAATTIATTLTSSGKDTHSTTSEDDKDMDNKTSPTVPTSSGKDTHATTSEDNKTSPMVVVVKSGDDGIIIGIVVVTAVVGLALLLVVICVVSVVLKKRSRMSSSSTPLLNRRSTQHADDPNENEYVIQQQQELRVHHDTAASSDQVAVSPMLEPTLLDSQQSHLWGFNGQGRPVPTHAPPVNPHSHFSSNRQS